MISVSQHGQFNYYLIILNLTTVQGWNTLKYLLQQCKYSGVLVLENNYLLEVFMNS